MSALDTAVARLQDAEEELGATALAMAGFMSGMAGQKAAIDSAKADAESAATASAASETNAASSAAQASSDAAYVATVVNDAEATLQASVTERTSADVFLFMGV